MLYGPWCLYLFISMLVFCYPFLCLDSGCGEGEQYKEHMDHDSMQSTLLFSHVRWWSTAMVQFSAVWIYQNDWHISGWHNIWVTTCSYIHFSKIFPTYLLAPILPGSENSSWATIVYRRLEFLCLTSQGQLAGNGSLRVGPDSCRKVSPWICCEMCFCPLLLDCCVKLLACSHDSMRVPSAGTCRQLWECGGTKLWTVPSLWEEGQLAQTFQYY